MGTASACVVVPVYNESAVLDDVLAGLMARFAHVVCVDDGSSDGSSAIAAASGATVLRHAVNLGQGAALQTGFDFVLGHTNFTHVVTFDSDGQHSPTDAVAMLAVAQEHAVDVVLGTRTRGRTPAGRRLLLRLALGFSRLATRLPLTDTHNGLRVLSRSAVQQLRLQQSGMAHASELEAAIARRGLSWVEVPVSIAYTDYARAKGQHGLNAVNVLYDLTLARLRTAP